MRQLGVLTLLVASVSLVQAQDAGPVKCKADGLHLCCGNCETSVTNILAKVDGVAAVKVDRKAADKVTFDAKSDKVAGDAFNALVKGGFYGKFSAGGKDVAVATPKVDAKGDELTFTGVHMCCNACVKAMKGLFSESKVTITGSGAMRDVTISGKSLDGQAVLNAMQKAGFSGTIQAK
jgi:copper chaperone CopZ